MKAEPRFPGVMQAKAYYDDEGNPKLEIHLDELKRLEKLLSDKLGREATVWELLIT